MSLAELGRGLLEATPDQVAALFDVLDPDEATIVQMAWERADLETWQAGRDADELRAEAEVDGSTWIRTLFPHFATAPGAPHMTALWEWVWDIRKGVRPRPRVEVWFRGGAKSSTAEAACISLGARGVRRYALYVSGTQHQADDHVESIGALLERPRFGEVYPGMAERAVGKYGTARGWSRTRLHTASGFIIDALGLQVEARGIRFEESRPDLIIFDDVDSSEDGPAIIQKKIDLLTKTVLPAGSQDLAVLGIQNVIHPTSIFARLCGVSSEPADFLADRETTGPIPAVEGLTVFVDTKGEHGRPGRHIVESGTPTWPGGYPLESAQAAIDTWGFTSFLQECQHEVRAKPGGMFSEVVYQHCTPEDVPPLLFRTCWVDPAVTDKDGSDCQGIQIDGMDDKGVIYRLWSWEARTGPLGALTRAIRMAIRFGSPTVGVETDQGGDTWDSVYREACEVVRTGKDGLEGITNRPFPRFEDEKAGSTQQSKAHRAGPMLADYEIGGRIVHVRGTHEVLEAALFRFPRTKPLDLADASVWSWRYCDKRRGEAVRIGSPSGVVIQKPPIVRTGPTIPGLPSGTASRIAAPGRNPNILRR